MLQVWFTLPDLLEDQMVCVIAMLFMKCMFLFLTEVRNTEESHQLDHISLDMPPGYIPDSSSVSVNVIGKQTMTSMVQYLYELIHVIPCTRGGGGALE